MWGRTYIRTSSYCTRTCASQCLGTWPCWPSLHLAPFIAGTSINKVSIVIMCGIFVSISRDAGELVDESLVALLAQRGPDCLEQLTTSIKLDPQTVTTSEQKPQNVYLTFVSTVLSLRGNTIIRQPLRDESSGSTLCWNGEAWRMSVVDIAANDTNTVFIELLKSSDHARPHQHGVDGCHTEPGGGCTSDTLSRVLYTLDSIKGPYAFVFLDKWHRRLFFGRDTLGRRSLVYRIAQNGSITIASVSDGDVSKAWKEVDADGVYMLDLARFGCPTGEGSVLEGGTFSVSKHSAVRLSELDEQGAIAGLGNPGRSFV